MAVVTKTLSPQTTGQECASPGIVVFQRTFVPLVASQLVGVVFPSATPVALAPRNDGQFWARTVAARPAIRMMKIAKPPAPWPPLVVRVKDIKPSYEDVRSPASGGSSYVLCLHRATNF